MDASSSAFQNPYQHRRTGAVQIPSSRSITANDATLPDREIIQYQAGFVIPSFGNDLAKYSNFYLPELGRQSVREFMMSIERVGPELRATAYEQVMTGMSAHITEVANVITAFGWYAMQDQGAMEAYGGLKKFQQDHEFLKDVEAFRESGAKRLAAHHDTIIANWGITIRDEVILPHSGVIWSQEKVVARLASISGRLTIKQAAPFFNHSMFARIATPSRGKSNSTRFVGADFTTAETLLKSWAKKNSNIPLKATDSSQWRSFVQWCNGQSATYSSTEQSWGTLRPEWAEWAKANSYRLHIATGLIIPRIDTELCDARFDHALSPAERQNNQIRSASLMSLVSNVSSALSSAMDVDSPTPSPQSVHVQKARGGQYTQSSYVGAGGSPHSMRTTSGGATPNRLRTLRQNIIQELLPATAPPRPVSRESTPAALATQLDIERPSLGRRMRRAIVPTDFDEEEFNDDVGPDALTYVNTKKNCRCSAALQDAIMQVGSRNVNNHELVPLLDEWYRQVGPQRESTAICYNHTKIVASQVGIATRGVSHQELLDLLFVIYFNQDKYGDFKTWDNTYQIFKPSRRPERSEDILMSYRFFPHIVRPYIDFDRVINVLGLQDMVKEFKKTGNVNDLVFGWVLDDPELKHILDEEYKMYRYHCRLRDGGSNLGWGRTQYHSLFQQLIRGDVYYYTLYAILRRAVCLISYPYYTKSAMPGDQTAFRHIDLNIKAAVHHGQMIDMIQGSVSWDDENDVGCTLVLTGLHNKLAEYQEWREKKGLPEGRNIQTWDDKVDFPAEISEQLGPEVKWIRNKCKAGMVRITDPRLPHGCEGPATIPRRTMLPWFVRVCDDMKTMEHTPMGTYAELAHAHRELVAAPFSPSGWPNKYGGINNTFPGAIPPEFSSYISKAIHCQLKWDSAPVIHELAELFGDDMTKASFWNNINGHRAYVTRHVKKAWTLCQSAEKLAYGERSYFISGGHYDGDTAHMTKKDAIHQLSALMLQDSEEKAQAAAAAHSRRKGKEAVRD